MKHEGNICRAAVYKVAPRRGAWVETTVLWLHRFTALVAPRRGAWVKHRMDIAHTTPTHVAPRRGAWVETYGNTEHIELTNYVAPRRGAWVETYVFGKVFFKAVVAPRRGAWVETPEKRGGGNRTQGRTPQGCVG